MREDLEATVADTAGNVYAGMSYRSFVTKNPEIY